MRELSGRGAIDRFFDALGRASQRVLLLDYDGTLAPFRVERNEAVPYGGVRELLAALIAAEGCRVAIVSGRSIADLAPLLGLDPLPELWGTHGWEHVTIDGTYEAPALDAAVSAALAAAEQQIRASGLADRCERKPASVAIHWRGLAAGEIDALRREMLDRWTPLAAQAGVELHPFDGGLELRARGRDKGFALRCLLSTANADAAVAFLGDDLTDEDGFRALSGRGLGVLVRSEYRATAADVWITPPDELIAFLERWLAVCGGDRAG